MTFQVQEAYTFSPQEKSVMRNMLNSNKGMYTLKDGSTIFNVNAFKETLQAGESAFNKMVDEDNKRVYNSTGYMRPIGVLEKMVDTLLEPATIRFATEYSFNVGSGDVSEKPVSLEDVIKPHRGMTLSEGMEKFIAPKIDYVNGELVVQTGSQANMYDTRNAQEDFGTVEYSSTPVLSYASTFKYTQNEVNTYQAHNIFGNKIQIDLKYQKFLERFDRQYKYDMMRSNSVYLADQTLLDQAGETAVDIGIPNNTSGLADSTLNDTQFETLLFKIVQLINNKNASLESIESRIRAFFMPLANVPALQSIPVAPANSALTNAAFKLGGVVNRFQWLLKYMQSNGVKVVASPLLDPSSSTGVYDSALAGTMSPTNAIPPRNRNAVDRPFYLLSSTNEDAQDILFTPKVTFAITPFVNGDPLGQTMIMGRKDLFSGIKYQRPEMSRVLIGTTNV